MATLQTDAREAVRVALGAARSEDLFDGVKAAVVTELVTLDPTVSIKTTDYFNHMSAPDLELSWPDDERAAGSSTCATRCRRPWPARTSSRSAP